MEHQPDPPRDTYGRYKLKTADGNAIKSYQRVTTFAKKISDTYNISLWNQRNVALGLAQRRDLYTLIGSFKDPHGQQKQVFQEKIIDQAIEASGAHSGANIGTSLHEFTADYDLGLDIDVLPPYDKDVEAYAQCLQSNGVKTFPAYVERVVSLDDIMVAGTYDRLVEYEGELFVLDCKTGKDPVKYPHEICVQLACYANADAMHKYDWDTETWEREPMPEVNKEWGIVAHILPGQASCSLYKFNIAEGWEAAKIIQQAIAWNKKRNLVVNFDGSKYNPKQTIITETKPVEAAEPGEGCTDCGSVVSASFRTLSVAKFGNKLCASCFGKRQKTER